MKELTIEEKAKAYDEAIERAKKLHETCDSQAVVGWCEYIFPELCESEDEKIREDIISLVNEFWERIGSINPEYSSRSRMLAWLEKQGTSYTKMDVNDAYLKGISDAKNELESKESRNPLINLNQSLRSSMLAEKLTDAFIDKASEWLCNNYDKYIRVIGSSIYPAYSDLCRDFQNYMKGK